MHSMHFIIYFLKNGQFSLTLGSLTEPTVLNFEPNSIIWFISVVREMTRILTDISNQPLLNVCFRKLTLILISTIISLIIKKLNCKQTLTRNEK